MSIEMLTLLKQQVALHFDGERPVQIAKYQKALWLSAAYGRLSCH